MAKVLLLFGLLIFFFTASHAQSHADSVTNRAADSVAKLADKTVKHLPADTTAKRTQADSLIKTGAVDSVKKQPRTDTTVQHQQADTSKHVADTIKHLAVDSIPKQQPADSVVKRMPADTLTKHQSTDSVTVKPARADSLIKQSPTDTLTKHQAADSVTARPVHTDSISKQKPPDSAVIHPAARAAIKKKPVAITSELKPSPLKTLSDERYNMLLKGEDFDHMSLVGELNNYPLPDQALKYKVQLGLNPGQITKLKALATELKRKKIEMGGYIIGNEKMLDSLFHSHKIEDGTLIFYTNRYGLYLGELRNAILQACYNTEAILSQTQIKKLESLEK